MNLYALKKIAFLFCAPKNIDDIARIDDNLIKIKLDEKFFYVNLNKSQSSIFCAREAILARKTYGAPFDLALKKYCARSEIINSEVDGNNRILRIFLRKKLNYKILESVLNLEFTGKYTNAIILNNDFVVLEALRKINNSVREVKIGAKLAPLPQQSAPKMLEIENLDEYLLSQYDEFVNKNLESARQSALQALNKKRESLLKQEILDEEALLKKSKNYALIGDLLKLNINSAKIQNPLKLIDYDGKTREFEIDFDISQKSAPAVINELFNKSKKLNAKAKNVRIQQENLREKLEFLDFKIEFVKSARTLGDIKMMHKKQAQNKKTAQKARFESFYIGEAKITIGKNQQENIELLKSAKASDMWLHVRGIPSSHVIISAPKNKIDEVILRKAGEIAVALLRAKSGNFLVDYTQRKFVKMKDGANVVYAHHQTMSFKK